MKPIAIVDDEKNIRDMIGFALKRENYLYTEFGNGEEAWRIFQTEMPELIILDIMMPRMDGMELCRRIRKINTDVPIIFLSSRDEEIDKVLGLESGGDDYVCKPFGMRELLARIRAALRRASADKETEKDETDQPNPGSSRSGDVHRGELFLNRDKFSVLWNRLPILLTVTEFRILESLVKQPGFVKSRQQLMEAAFPNDNYISDRAADSHIKRIRAKFAVIDPEFCRLETIYGLGYRYNLA